MIASCFLVHYRSSRLVIGEDQRVCNHNVLPATGSKDDDLGDIVWRQGFAALVHGVGLVLVAIEAHDRELCLDLARIDANDTNPARDELLAQRVRERSHRGLGGAIDGAADVGFPAGDRADVDDVAGASTVISGEHLRQNSLSHVDKSSDVGGEHDVEILLLDLRGLSHASNETAENAMSVWLVSGKEPTEIDKIGRK